jgi:hypothetical protein
MRRLNIISNLGDESPGRLPAARVRSVDLATALGYWVRRVCTIQTLSTAMCILLTCLAILVPKSMDAQVAISANQLKAAYLLNFIKFVEFPQESMGNSMGPIVIGVVGEDPFEPYLQQAVAGKTLQGRNLVVRIYRSGDDLRAAQIIFISASEKKRIPQILSGLQGSGSVTVADIDGFLEQGGMVRFLSEGGQARFAINLNATSRENIKISSKLKAVARLIGGN